MMGVLVAVGFLTASQAWGQSACQQLGVNCNWNSQSQGILPVSQSTGPVAPVVYTVLVIDIMSRLNYSRIVASVPGPMAELGLEIRPCCVCMSRWCRGATVWKFPISADKVLTSDQANQRPSRVLLMLASEKPFFSDANLTGNSPVGQPLLGHRPFPGWMPRPGARRRLNHLPFGLHAGQGATGRFMPGLLARPGNQGLFPRPAPAWR